MTSFLVGEYVWGGVFVRCLVWGENFSWRKHEWCGSWSAKNQKGGFMGVNALVEKWCRISSQSSTPIISMRCGTQPTDQPYTDSYVDSNLRLRITLLRIHIS